MKHYFFILAAGCALIACSPRYYTPNTQNVPLFTELGQANLTVAGGSNRIELQGAYAMADHMAVQVNGGFFGPKDLSNGNGGSGKFVEIGGGYFKKASDKLIFETYGLLGVGLVENHLPSTLSSYPETNGKIDANMWRYGIQPNLGYRTKYFVAAISSRFVNMNYTNIEGNLKFDDMDQVKYLLDNHSNFLIEPAFTIKGGFEHIKLQLQYLHSFNISNRNFRQDNSVLTIGLNGSF